MTNIIAGRFDQSANAESALAELRRAGFAAEEMSTFFVNPRGQHDLLPVGGDTDDSRAAHKAPAGAAVGGALGGAIGLAATVGAVIATGPAAPVVAAAVAAGTGVGAYTGSLAGTLNNLGKRVPADQADATEKSIEEEAPPRKSGMLVAVKADDEESQQEAIGVLRGEGAFDIERNSGAIIDGEWVDFDPLKPLALVE